MGRFRPSYRGRNAIGSQALSVRRRVMRTKRVVMRSTDFVRGSRSEARPISRTFFDISEALGASENVFAAGWASPNVRGPKGHAARELGA